MHRFRPLRNRLLRRLRPEAALERSAAEITLLQPEEVEAVRPPIALPSQAAKATAGVPGHMPLAGELAVAAETRRTHAPVIRYVLEDCLVHPGGVEYPGGSIGKQPLRLRALAGPVAERSRALYAMSGVSHQYFGHWLQDACPTALLADPGEGLILDIRSDWPHARAYAAAFGFAPENAPLIHVERLTVVQDHGQGSHKRLRYAELRRRLAAAFGPASEAGSRVYFRRGASGVARLIANDAEVERALTAIGFEVFDLEGASAAEIWRRFAGAATVVSMEGSHLNHLHFALPPGAVLLTLVPADRFSMTQVAYAAAAGVRFGFVVVDPGARGYAVPVGDLLATLDLA